MTLIAALLLTAWAATIAALFMTIHRHDQRTDRLITILTTERAANDHQRAQPHPDTTALIALVEQMAQRIQAPQAAVTAHDLNTVPPSPPAVAFDNDDDYWKAQEPVSKEALAEALMAAETNG